MAGSSSLFSGPMPSATSASLLGDSLAPSFSDPSSIPVSSASRSLFQPPPEDSLPVSSASAFHSSPFGPSSTSSSFQGSRNPSFDDIGHALHPQPHHSHTGRPVPAPLHPTSFGMHTPSPGAHGVVGRRPNGHPPRTPPVSMPGDNLYAQVFAGAVVESGHMVRGSHSHHNLASMHQSGGQSPFYSQQNQHHAYQHSSNLPPHHPQSMSASHSFNNLLSLQRQLQQQQQQPKQPEVVSELTQAQLIALVESLSSLEVSHLTARTASHADLLAAVAGQGRPAASFLSAPPSHDEHASFDSSAFGSSTLNAAASPFPAPSSYASDQSIRRATSMPSMSTRCPNQRLGCNWHGTLELHAAHLAECPCQSVTCRYAKFGCTVRCVRADMSAHLERAMAAHLEMCESKIEELTNALNGSSMFLPPQSPTAAESVRRKKTSSGSLEEYPPVGDQELVLLLTRILFEHGKASVGKLGSLLHSYTNNHGLSAMCKEKFGGLKKFLELHPQVFSIGADHPFNPTVWLAASLQPQLLNLLQQQQPAPSPSPPSSDFNNADTTADESTPSAAAAAVLNE